ncbi:MAG: FAD-dependent monooxygenase [Trebonia sp.]
MDHAIVIAGAGPTGLMLACELGLAGVDAVVLDQSETPETGPNLRSHMLHARAVDLLDWRGLMDPIRAAGEPMVWPMIHFANLWLDLSTIIDHEHSLIVPQTRTARVLEERATELGADIRRGHEVTGVSQDEAGVTVEVRDAAGHEYQIRSRYLVGCDGEDSAVRELAGFDAPAGGPSWYGVLADFEKLDAAWESPTYPGGLVAVSPHPDKSGWTRVMTMEFGVHAPDAAVPVTLDELRANAERISGRAWNLERPVWLYRYAGRTRLAGQYRRGSVFLAGEAAHVHYMGAGHATSTSLHDAANLGWKLAADVRGWAPPGLLDTYHDERHPVGHRACMSTHAQLLLQYPQSEVAPLRELFGEIVTFPDVNRHLAEIVTKVSYPMEAGRPDGAEPHPLLGGPVPDVTLTTQDGPVRAGTLLRSGRGVLLDLSAGTADLGDVSAWAARVDVVTAKPAEEVGAAALLIRPDGHVAWAGTRGRNEAELRAALMAWFGSAG